MTAIGSLIRRAEEADTAGCLRTRANGFGIRGSDGRVARTLGQVGIDEPGVYDQAFHIPYPGVGWRCQVSPYGLDQTVADDNGSTVEGLARAGNDFTADECMGAEWQRPKSRRRQFTSLGTGQEGGQQKRE